MLKYTNIQDKLNITFQSNNVKSIVILEKANSMDDVYGDICYDDKLINYKNKYGNLQFKRLTSVFTGKFRLSKVQLIKDSQSFMIKENCDRKDRKILIKTKSLLSMINHENIVKLWAVVSTAEKLQVVLDYCPNGDMKEYLER